MVVPGELRDARYRIAPSRLKGKHFVGGRSLRRALFCVAQRDGRRRLAGGDTRLRAVWGHSFCLDNGPAGRACASGGGKLGRSRNP
jgi:hypothetical protein